MEGATNTPIERDRLRDWSRRDDAPGLRHAAGHLALLAATGAVVWAARGTLWIWPAMLVHGVVLVFLFAAFTAFCAGLLRVFLRRGFATPTSAARTLELPVLATAGYKPRH
mgnify:CR=1 FL=1